VLRWPLRGNKATQSPWSPTVTKRRAHFKYGSIYLNGRGVRPDYTRYSNREATAEQKESVWKELEGC